VYCKIGFIFANVMASEFGSGARRARGQCGSGSEIVVMTAVLICGIPSGKLEVETVQQRQNNASLQQHLESVR
jgi:hypothetical protein